MGHISFRNSQQEISTAGYIRMLQLLLANKSGELKQRPMTIIQSCNAKVRRK